MKTIMKIAVIAMMGMSLGVNGQEKEEIVTSKGQKSDFIYTNGNLSLGDQLYTGSVFNILKKPSDNEAHLFIGNPYSQTSSGIVSSRLSFAGTGIQHAGLAWVPSNNNSKGDGKFHLSFGAYQNPIKNSIKYTFQSNGNLGIGTRNPESPLEIRQKEDPNRDRALVISEPNNSQKIYLHLADNASGEYGFFSLGGNTYLRGNGQVSSFDGPLGIGITQPTETLTLAKSGAALGIYDKNPLSKSNNRIGRYSNSLVIQNDLSGSWSDNINFHDNGGVGIGTRNPESPLEIRQKEDPNRDRALVISEPNNSQKIYLHLADNASGEYGFFSLGGNTNLRGNGQVSSFDGPLGIGTTNVGSWKLAVNGAIRAKEIKVETGWSDFVFYDNYKLPTLKEVENHIKEKGHLKDIPSAEEVEKSGIFLGEMDARLLQKIEELTLYTIAQEKKIKKLEKQNSKVEEQEKKIERLEFLVQKLLKDKN